ncbi:MAG: DUF362 domain-containing protein [Anaerolineae bacterium]
MPATVHFASMAYDRLDADQTLPAKFRRILALYPLEEMVQGKRVAVKMHLGGNLGYSTIPPLFVRILVQALKDAGGQVFVTDSSWAVDGAAARGYTHETVGAPLIPVAGLGDRYFYAKPVGYRSLKEVRVAGEIHDADVLIDFSHVKGHGCCAYGGACKNLAMGCVTGDTRSQIHSLEGGLMWDEDLCTHCESCIDACRYGAARFDDEGRFHINYHNCHYCQHCANACPQHAIKLDPEGFHHFQEGMALATHAVLDTFDPARVLFINLLINITYVCDCWGLTTPALVPDIGLLVSRDIVAIEQASLDLIKPEDLILQGLPRGKQLGSEGHLFQRIHGKDPCVQLDALARQGLGSRAYERVEVC